MRALFLFFVVLSFNFLQANEKLSKEMLKENKCVPCKGGIAPLKGELLSELHSILGDSWQIVDEHHLEKVWHFNNFQEALDFTNKVGFLAEEEGHHPDIHLAWGKVKLIIWTHKIDGLSISDFILAAKCDEL